MGTLQLPRAPQPGGGWVRFGSRRTMMVAPAEGVKPGDVAAVGTVRFDRRAEFKAEPWRRCTR